MSGNKDEKKDQLPPPQEEEKGVMQAEAQAEEENTNQQGDTTPVPPWTGYDRFSTVCGRRSKAEFAEEFYARNALVQNYKLAQYNLDAYQKCHIAHQRRRLACNSLYWRNWTTAAGLRVHSLSKNQLEEAN